MFGSAAVARPNSPKIIQSFDSKRKDTFLSRCTEIYESKQWKPPALRAPVLILTIAMCWSLIAVLQILLWKSQRDSGLIFAPSINDLPLRQTFLYLYFPTILAVVFSIYWAWIDLETKRMEPYYQLSKENGALGKDSLLLHYPFDFIPLVPLKALRDRHWPVFWASFAVVLVTWGLVPTQAGIFSVRSVTRNFNTTFAVSTSSIPVDQQATALTFGYAQSTYGIVSLNETLPAYMARNYTLAPFKPLIEGHDAVRQGTHTAPTTMYFMDLDCEDVSHKANNSTTISYASSNGCKFDLGLTGNLTSGQTTFPDNEITATKLYSGMYVGYYSGQYSDYYLYGECPKTANTTFYAAFQRNKMRVEDPPQDVTAIFCQSRYYQQEVLATVDMLTKLPLNTTPLGEKQVLPWYAFNVTWFEGVINSGAFGVEGRGDSLPAKGMPTYLETIAGTDLSAIGGFGTLQPMVGLAVSTSARPLQDYLDWRALSKSYADAYQLLFVRAMVDVLGNGPKSSKVVEGRQQITTETVTLEPIFVYIVEGFLSVVSLATIALLVISLIRKRRLGTDPSTIASIMAMVAGNEPLLADFANLDCCTVDDMQSSIGHKRYKLFHDEAETGIVEVASGHSLISDHRLFSGMDQRTDSPSSIAKPVRPREFRLWAAFPFINLFFILAIVLGVIFGKAYTNGLPIPSSNTIVQNIVENYIPTAVATLIEPMWILINRLLCMLQPLEELQDCNAKAKKSIDLNYSSLPPQLVIFQAFRSKHFVLAAVCVMALLANVLAITLAGLFNQRLADIRYTTTFQPMYESRFVPINGSVGPQEGGPSGSLRPSGAYQGGDGEDQFLIAESNVTKNTPLPAWTDERMFYMPIAHEGFNDTHTNLIRHEAITDAFGAELDCKQLDLGNVFNASLATEHSDIQMAISMEITIASGSGNVRCTGGAFAHPGPLKDLNHICVGGPSAVELVSLLDARTNATQEEKNVCMGSLILGWMRETQGTCPIGKDIRITDQNSLFVHCQPRLLTGRANILVDASGRLQRPADIINIRHISENDTRNLFNNDPINLIGQSNQYLFQADMADFHNDSFAGDFFNYFVRRASNSTRIVDPNQPVPTFKDVLGPLNAAYSKLFAIWLGTNKAKLFVPITVETRVTVTGTRIQPEERLFLSTTMFIISEAILCTYIIVAIWVYLRRPGQYLARMPTSIASVIALFAASSAVQDMQGTSHLDRKGRARHLESLDARYGYGSFIGAADGRIHIGLEKRPFVRTRAKTTWLEQRIPRLKKGSVGEDWSV